MLTRAEVKIRYGLSTQTLMSYERHGLIRPARAGNAKLYGPNECLRIEVIQKAISLKFSLDEIRQLIDQIAADERFRDQS